MKALSNIKKKIFSPRQAEPAEKSKDASPGNWDNIQCENRELKAFYDKVSASRRLDNSFALNTDVDLTEDEIKRIDEFWGKYSFAYPEIDYKSFKTFKNRYGKFDVRHCPGAIKTRYLNSFFNNKDYFMAYQNKGLLRLLYPDVKMPRTIVRRMNGLYYDENYNHISAGEAIHIMLENLSQPKEDGRAKRLIIKPSGLGGGRGVFFVDNESTYDSLQAGIKALGISAFVVQEFLTQSSFMAQFNPTSVNTLRISSLLYKGEVHVLAALVRIGKAGSDVDNYSQGGSLLGVDKETGICNSWAITHDHQRITTLPSGLKLDDEPIAVPEFEKIKECIRRLHYYNPYTKYISWDIALDEGNDPVLIETNHAGMTQIHEAVTGPLFGELTEELLDEYLLKRFCVQFRAESWICNEYHDHIEISKYDGSDTVIYVPKMIRGKRVTRILSKAFAQNTEIEKIYCPQNLTKYLPPRLKETATEKI